MRVHRPALLLASSVLFAQLDLPTSHPSLAGLPSATSAVRALVFGDSGSPKSICVDHADQKRLADAMFADRPFHFGLTVGDNFYASGVKSLEDKHWKCSWDDQYARFSIPFLATLGNHDTRGKAEVQVQRAGAGGFWMPARYYTYQAGPIQFFALDTDEGTTESKFLRLPINKPWSQTQLDWLKQKLTEHSGAPWKIVYGHHPIFTSGEHGKDARPKFFREKLLPLLKEMKVDMYIAGHDHHMEYIEDGGLQYFISGGGGRELREPDHALPPGITTTAKMKSFGYLVLDADPSKLTVTMKTLQADGTVKSTVARSLSK